MARILNKCYYRAMTTPHDWAAACDVAAGEMLALAGVFGPPVDVLVIAQQLQIELAWDASQSGRARLQRLSGRPAIFLRPGDRPERVQWAAAHELGEQLAESVVTTLGLSATELLPRQREEIANQLANRILLPSDWFESACRACHGDLYRLKETFSTASHELLAWRLLDQSGDRIVTMIDQGQVSRRRCNFAQRAPTPLSIETETWRRAGETGHYAVESSAGCAVRVWPVHEPEWKREIAVTEVDAEQWTEFAGDADDS
ncbi:MAG TPA: ImmA/IrrE family metallo-endopeptidase [Planctomycetaceae bacterium]|nr:ImmA/IrrE family metallo-endopeptidase [Planctomycetaceae bacterium]